MLPIEYVWVFIRISFAAVVFIEIGGEPWGKALYGTAIVGAGSFVCRGLGLAWRGFEGVGNVYAKGFLFVQ